MIPGIVLAGGKSSRMGRPKALLPIGSAGDTFFDRVTRTLLEAGLTDVVVVVGADAHAIRAAVKPRMGVRIVDNADYERGQLTSLLAGLRAIDAAGAVAALVTLIDVPLVHAETVRTLIAVQRERRAVIVRPVSNGRHGHPVIFARQLFEELQRADAAQGAKPVVRAHAAEMIEVPIDDEGAFIDIDTPEEYERFIGSSGADRH
jgi:molybdenum cofactor cytidylyltransferase